METEKNNKSSKLSLAFSLIGLGVILVVGRPQPIPDLENYTFESEPVMVQGLYSTNDNLENVKPRRIVIPELSVDLGIRQAEIINGYWEVFVDSAAWGSGSGIPGRVGNQVIFAHAKENLFLPLRDVEEGMNILVLTLDEYGGSDFQTFSYKVTEIREVSANETHVIAPTTEEEILTLYTCSGFADSKRLVVTSKRI